MQFYKFLVDYKQEKWKINELLDFRYIFFIPRKWYLLSDISKLNSEENYEKKLEWNHYVFKNWHIG